MDTCISITWIHKKEESAHWWSSTGKTHSRSSVGELIWVGHPDFFITEFRLDGSAEPSNEILEQGSHDRPLMAQTYSAAVTKGMSPAWFDILLMHIFFGNLWDVSISMLCYRWLLLQNIFPVWPCFPGYCEEQGAVGGAGLEDDLNDLRLEEENEQPPLILETDWAGGRPDPSIRGLLWCCCGKCDTQWGGRIQRPGVFLNAVQELVRAIICSHTFVIFLPQFRLRGSNWCFACTCANRRKRPPHGSVWERVLDVWFKKKKK